MKYIALFVVTMAMATTQCMAGNPDQEKIVIGQSIELSGLATGKDNVEGVQAYLTWVNNHGGVHGRQILLKTYDDKGDPKLTKQNTERLSKDDGAIALLAYRGTPRVEAVLPLLERDKLDLIGPATGAQSLRHPFNPYVFHVRATYQHEAEKMVDSLSMLQIKDVAVLVQDDTFGLDGMTGFERALEKQKLKPLAVVKYERKDATLESAVKQISATNPRAVLMACNAKACSTFIKGMRARKSQPLFLMLSNVSSDDFFKSLGDDGRGIGITQVMPYPQDLQAAVVQEFQRIRKGMQNPPPLSYAALEGFVSAKLVVEGLRRTGPNPTRQKLHSALETMKDFDLGGIRVNYSPASHDGSQFVELIVIGKNGAIWR